MSDLRQPQAAAIAVIGAPSPGLFRSFPLCPPVHSIAAPIGQPLARSPVLRLLRSLFLGGVEHVQQGRVITSQDFLNHGRLAKLVPLLFDTEPDNVCLRYLYNTGYIILNAFNTSST